MMKLTINVPVVYMERDVMILMQAIPLQGPLEVVMSNQRFLKIESFRFPPFVPKKNRIYSFFKLNLLLNQKVFFQI
jgi:hypothetical protein